jgi:hypothetical protein
VSGIIYRSDTPGREGLEWSRSRVKVMSLMLRDRGERMEASQHPDDEQLFGK